MASMYISRNIIYFKILRALLACKSMILKPKKELTFVRGLNNARFGGLADVYNLADVYGTTGIVDINLIKLLLVLVLKCLSIRKKPRSCVMDFPHSFDSS